MNDSMDEARALSRDERALADAARQPALGEHGDGDLADLITRLRDRRDRARTLAERQRREMRGKAAPAGASPAGDDTGARAKAGFLADALRRAEEEQARRRGEGAPTQADLAGKALEMRREAEDARPPIPETRAADEGMRSIPNDEAAPSGAFDDVGDRPVLERSRKVR